MSTGKTGTRYDEDFKQTLVNLYQSGGKTQAALITNIIIQNQLTAPKKINTLQK